MTHEMKAAIIGYYRCGNTFKAIAKLLGIDEVSIKRVVNYYLTNGKHN